MGGQTRLTVPESLDGARFDLVVATDIANVEPASRLLETLDDPDFRAELAHLPGYDGSLTGQVTTVEAA